MPEETGKLQEISGETAEGSPGVLQGIPLGVSAGIPSEVPQKISP